MWGGGGVLRLCTVRKWGGRVGRGWEGLNLIAPVVLRRVLPSPASGFQILSYNTESRFVRMIAWLAVVLASALVLRLSGVALEPEPASDLTFPLEETEDNLYCPSAKLIHGHCKELYVHINIEKERHAKLLKQPMLRCFVRPREMPSCMSSRNVFRESSRAVAHIGTSS